MQLEMKYLIALAAMIANVANAEDGFMPCDMEHPCKLAEWQAPDKDASSTGNQIIFTDPPKKPKPTNCPFVWDNCGYGRDCMGIKVKDLAHRQSTCEYSMAK